MDDWRHLNLAATARWGGLGKPLLLDLGRQAWGLGRGRRWELRTTAEAADWRLLHICEQDAALTRYEQLGVRATIDPVGELVAFQIDNGVEFLALADTSAASLRRGLRHLLGKGLPTFEASAPPFEPTGGEGPLGWLQRFVR